MSVVWRAFDEVLGRQVAVKELDGPHAGNPDFRRAIRREARAVARLTHPNIGVVYDYGESSDGAGVAIPYVVMELIYGPTLGERLGAGTLSWRAAVGVCDRQLPGRQPAARGLRREWTRLHATAAGLERHAGRGLLVDLVPTVHFGRKGRGRRPGESRASRSRPGRRAEARRRSEAW
ncbi:hypothetical protein [Rugosimonospora africana]|nr:hypothetical protein [Rugosimonospora africana]